MALASAEWTAGGSEDASLQQAAEKIAIRDTRTAHLPSNTKHFLRAQERRSEKWERSGMEEKNP